jgi:hypothetical protein
LRDFLIDLAPKVIEFGSFDRLPDQLLSLLTALECPYDTLLVSTEVADVTQSDECAAANSYHLIGGARAVVAIDADAEDFAREKGLTIDAPRKPAKRRAGAPKRALTTAKRLGVIVPQGSVAEFRFLKELGLQTLTRSPDLEIIVFGATADDLALMQMPHIHVTGTISADELGQTLIAYAVDRMVIGPGRTVFGHPTYAAAISAGLPSVRFGASPSRRKSDLWMAPGTPDGVAARQVADWLA